MAFLADLERPEIGRKIIMIGKCLKFLFREGKGGVYLPSYISFRITYRLCGLFLVLLHLTLRNHPLASDGTAQGFLQFPNSWTTHALLLGTRLVCSSHISHCSIFVILSTRFPLVTTSNASDSFLQRSAAVSPN